MFYTVAVDSRGFSADYSDLLLVVADATWEAKQLAEDFIQDTYPGREILSSEAYVYGNAQNGVIGRALNEDE